MSAPKFCPHYPAPVAKRPPWWKMFFSKQHSWLDGLYVRSYAMKMGEVHLPGLDLYMVNDPGLVKRVLVDEADAFPKSDLLAKALRPLLGDSIFTTHGEQWRQQRVLMEPAFEGARIRHVYGHMVAAADAMVTRLNAIIDGDNTGPSSVVNIEAEMTHVAADIILRTILSQPLAAGDATQVFEAFSRYQALAPKMVMPALFGLRWWRPWRGRAQSHAAAREIRGLLVKLIQPRYEQAQMLAKEASRPSDLLGYLLAARDPASGQGFSFDALVDQVAMLFLAGHETTASALSWSLHLMSQVPEVQQRMHDEAALLLDAALANPAELRALTLCRNVFKETLRLFPPVGFLARQSRQACAMRDKALPEDSTVVVSPWLIQRHRAYWARPDEFDPDRYDANDEASGPAAQDSVRRAYLPFGLGPRVCIGAAFALQEASLILATVAKHFELRPVEGRHPKPVGRLTIRSDNGVWLELCKRGA
ncbi:MAG: cytochrome P450 [Ideonella sp. MAG2]|nr:MAG: cytochrome P450 [Ideonella sp. MAG2]